MDFEWDPVKNFINQHKHDVSFEDAQHVFDDQDRVVFADDDHSDQEQRYYCIGSVNNKILTVRYMRRHDRIRIIGAGRWRKGKKIYEQANQKKS